MLLAYGLGHGGLEMLYLGMGSLISLLILFSLIQSSNTDVANLLPKSTLETVQSLSVWQVYLLGVERVLALVPANWSLYLGLSKCPSKEMDLPPCCLWFARLV